MRKIPAEVFALAAAGLNGTIGVFTRFGLENSSPFAIAFWKCFVAFMVLLPICLAKAPLRQQTQALVVRWKPLALLAFLGIFALYFFETWAFSEASIPLVSFLTYAAGVFTILLSVLVLNEKMTWYKATAFALILVGICLLFLFEANVSGSYFGIFLAVLGGLGYALFIFFSKFFNLPSGLPLLVWLFGFGSIYLFVPFAMTGLSVPDPTAWLMIFALVLLPSIGGFYCTTKAVEQGEAGKVQIIETTDPLFSALFAFLIFGDLLAPLGMVGAGLIMVGLLFSLKK